MYNALYDPIEPEGFVVFICNMDAFELALRRPLVFTFLWRLFGRPNFDVSGPVCGLEDIYVTMV